MYATESFRTTAVREIKQLVEQIVDDGLQTYAALNFLPIQEALEAVGALSPGALPPGALSPGALSSLRADDDVLSQLVNKMASGHRFEQSAKALELMASPAAQASALIDLSARDSLDRLDVSVGDRAALLSVLLSALLESIQQRYRVAEPSARLAFCWCTHNGLESLGAVSAIAEWLRGGSATAAQWNHGLIDGKFLTFGI